MSNKSIIDEAIDQMQQKMVDSRGNRTGDYRIGLDAAINILENLREMHKKEIEKSVDFAIQQWGGWDSLNGEQYYNETYGGNKWNYTQKNK